MKIFLFFLATSITLGLAYEKSKKKCPHGVWGCSGTNRAYAKHVGYRSRRQGGEIRLDIGRRDDAGDVGTGKGCAFGDRRCRERMLRLLKGLETKRQVDCPFGVWGCKRAVGLDAPEEPCRRGTRGCEGKRRHRRGVNYLIEELFAKSGTAPK